jgi:hypothetical protein
MTSPADDDLLSRASRALRDEASSDPPDAADAWRAMDGWRQVSRDVQRAARRRRLALIVAVQVVAAVVGVGAWAAVSGRLPQLFSSWAPAAHQTPPARPARAHVARAHRAAPPVDPPVDPPVLPPAVVAAVPEPAPVAVPAPPPRPPVSVAIARPVARAPVRPASPAPRPPVASEADDTYRQAHEAQFALHDYAAAVDLWDHYLATGGRSLALEARWNRAIALVHVGRREAAVAALTPFAAGENNGYRQEEAQALLRVLGASPP